MRKWENGKMEKWKNEKMENGTRCLMSEGKRNLVTESILLIVVTQVGREYQLATIQDTSPGPLIILGSLVFNILPICRAISVFPVPEFTKFCS